MRNCSAAARAHVDLGAASSCVQSPQFAHMRRVEDFIQGLTSKVTRRRTVQHVALAAGIDPAIVLYVHSSPPQVMAAPAARSRMAGLRLNQIGFVFLYTYFI